MINELIHTLELGGVTYTKLIYSPMEAADLGSEFITYSVGKDIQKLNEMYNKALLRVSADGDPLSYTIKVNNFFASRMEYLLPVRMWALLEGLKSFLEYSPQAEELISKYSLG
jgi:hypothetical protein